MKSIDKTLEYHELLMVCDDLNNFEQYVLPYGYRFEFWESDEDLNAWVEIHIRSGEFTSKERAKNIFYEFYGDFIKELNKRCVFIIDEQSGDKVATATISPADEYGYKCVVDWLAIKKSHQGKKLGKPLISKIVNIAKDLGYKNLLLHTQTHTWLAAKLYLDMGFYPFRTDIDNRGWQILKTITNHKKLNKIKFIDPQYMYMEEAINIVNFLDNVHKNYEYQIWHKNGMNDVYVRENDVVFEYKYFNKGTTLEIVRKYQD